MQKVILTDPTAKLNLYEYSENFGIMYILNNPLIGELQVPNPENAKLIIENIELGITAEYTETTLGLWCIIDGISESFYPCAVWHDHKIFDEVEICSPLHTDTKILTKFARENFGSKWRNTHHLVYFSLHYINQF
jgi:hypothetical protein